MLLVLERAIALGNGDRKQGETLATYDGEPDVLVAAAQAAVGNHDLTVLPGKLTPADGVAACEILTALRNPRLVAFVPRRVEQQQPEPDATAEKKAPAKPRARGR